MKVVLLQDVAKLGHKYDMKEVSAGYASNFLFPQKLAVPATKETEANILKKKGELEAEKKIKDELLIKNITALDGAKITIKAKTNKEGHLYAKIHKKEIAGAIKEQLSINIPEEVVDLEEPIKEAGKTPIEIASNGAKSKLNVFVEGIT